MNSQKKGILNLVNNFIFFLILLFAFNLINEHHFIKSYDWPNFGDNYIFGLGLFVIFLIRLKTWVNFFKLIKKSDMIFICILIYIFLMESFYFKDTNYVLLRDLFGIFFVFRVFQEMQINKKVEKIFNYLSFTFIFLSASYFLIYFLWAYFNYEFSFIFYGNPSLKSFFFFKIFFLFLFAYFYNKNFFSYYFYFISLLIIYYFTTRAALLSFLIIPLMVFITHKKKKIFLIAHLLIVVILFGEYFVKSYKNTFISKDLITQTIEQSRYKDPTDNSLTIRETNPGEVNSTATRFFHFERNFKNLSNNILLGSGYQSIKQSEYQLIAKTCECSLFHPLFAYGILMIIIFFIFFYFLYVDYKNYFTNKKQIYFLISLSILFIFYSASLPLLPAWFGIGFYLTLIINGNELKKC